MIWAEPGEESTACALWAAARIPHMHGGQFAACQAGVIERDGKTAAVVVFYNWQQEAKSLQVSVGYDTPMWCRPPVLRAIFEYAFRQCGAHLLHVGTPHTNTGTLAFLKRIGFCKDGVLRHRYGKKLHAVTFSMTEPEWRKSKYFVREVAA